MLTFLQKFIIDACEPECPAFVLFLTIVKSNAIVIRGRNIIIKSISFLVNYIFILFENLRMLIQK